MLEQIEMRVCNSVGLLFFLAVAFGLAYQPAATALNPIIAYLLMVVMFLGFMKIDFATLKKEIKSIRYHIWLIVLQLLIIPIVIYYLLYCLSLFIPWISPDFKVGALIFFGTITAAIAAPLAILYKGHLERTMLNLVISSILMIGTLPLLFTMLVHNSVPFSYMQLFVFMLELIVAPMVLAIVVRRTIPALSQILKPHIPAVSVLLLTLVILGCVMGLDIFFVDDTGKVIAALISSALCLLLSLSIGWFLSLRSEHADHVTSAIICSMRNIGIAVVIADQLFRQDEIMVVLFVSLTTIPFILMVFPIKYLANHLK